MAWLGVAWHGQAWRGKVQVNFLKKDGFLMATNFPVAELVFDRNIYPRAEPSSGHIALLADALRAGESFPPILVEKITKRIIDGVHRWKAWQRVNGDDSEILCEFIEEPDEAKLFVLCVEHNTAHGLLLTPFERTTCMLKLEKLGVTRETALSALRMSAGMAVRIEEKKTAFRIGESGERERVALKGMMHTFHGETLTKKQQETNRTSGGMRAEYYVNQIIGLLESGVCAKASEAFLEQLRVLHKLLEEKLPRKKKSA
jgi:hypothetical protein